MHQHRLAFCPSVPQHTRRRARVNPLLLRVLNGAIVQTERMFAKGITPLCSPKPSYVLLPIPFPIPFIMTMDLGSMCAPKVPTLGFAAKVRTLKTVRTICALYGHIMPTCNLRVRS
jgi:hypothetical protein